MPALFALSVCLGVNALLEEQGKLYGVCKRRGRKPALLALFVCLGVNALLEERGELEENAGFPGPVEAAIPR